MDASPSGSSFTLMDFPGAGGGAEGSEVASGLGWSLLAPQFLLFALLSFALPLRIEVMPWVPGRAPHSS